MHRQAQDRSEAACRAAYDVAAKCQIFTQKIETAWEMEIVRSELGPNVNVYRVVVALGPTPGRRVSISQGV